MLKNHSLKTVTFYVVAHADDWQLFMNPDAFKDITKAENKLVFIVTTAGDAGKKDNYWKAREEGMKSSIRFCLAPFTSVINSTQGAKKIKDNAVNFWSANHIICYFLRLPDGGLDGNGFEITGNKSLQKLKNGEISELRSLDNAIQLSTWTAFCEFLETIISLEAAGFSKVAIKYINPSPTENPHDHPDHKATGQAVQALSHRFLCRQTLFAAYGNSSLKVLPPKDIFWKSGMVATYEKAVFDACGYSTLGENVLLYQKWILSAPQFYVKKKDFKIEATNSAILP